MQATPTPRSYQVSMCSKQVIYKFTRLSANTFALTVLNNASVMTVSSFLKSSNLFYVHEEINFTNGHCLYQFSLLTFYPCCLETLNKKGQSTIYELCIDLMTDVPLGGGSPKRGHSNGIQGPQGSHCPTSQSRGHATSHLK